MTRIAVFASGNGSNLQALIDAIGQGKLRAEIKLVVSDRPDCHALQRARSAGIAVLAFEPADFRDKAHYEGVIAEELAKSRVEYLVLAGYMRLIGSTLLQLYPRRIINIHPSLLPHFPGKDAIGRALAAGAAETGVTVHYVDEGIDTGPVIAQERIAVVPGEGRADLEQKIHAVEHRLYPQVLRQIFQEEEKWPGVR
ncbi:MAG: phosphoribosylglycinamide formyltransferase [Bacillota bacterium]|nr:phosphoribosylglycinamide formyltransferase [Bacillota bacterium]NLJ03586.1 phosphoribosylglycinamide formyltransferase [Bacillota bacterium]